MGRWLPEGASHPLDRCNSDLAQYSHTPLLPPATLRVAMRAWPSLRVAGFEDEDEYEALCEGEGLSMGAVVRN
jgi:hypothetical protein